MAKFERINAAMYDDLALNNYNDCYGRNFLFLLLPENVAINDRFLSRLGRYLARTPEGKPFWEDFRAVANSRPLYYQWVEELERTRLEVHSSCLGPVVAVDFTDD
jgi:hypothetical protein